MTNTNRGLNRFFIFVVGLLLFAAGVVAVLASSVPAVRRGWDTTAPVIRQNVDGVFASTRLFSTGISWVGLIVALLLTALAIMLVIFILKQGHGRTNRLIRDNRTEHGVTVVESAIAEDILKDALADRPELISANVSTYDVQGTPTLNIAVKLRRGVSPKDVAVTVEKAVLALDAVLGREIPAVVQIGGGFRSRTTAPTRLQ